MSGQVKNYIATSGFVRNSVIPVDISGVVNQSVSIATSGLTSFELNISGIRQQDPEQHSWIFSLNIDGTSVDFPAVSFRNSDTLETNQCSLSLVTSVTSGTRNVRVQVRPSANQNLNNELQFTSNSLFNLLITEPVEAAIGTVWGTITGNIADQADLQAALAGNAGGIKAVTLTYLGTDTTTSNLAADIAGAPDQDFTIDVDSDVTITLQPFIILGSGSSTQYTNYIKISSMGNIFAGNGSCVSDMFGFAPYTITLSLTAGTYQIRPRWSKTAGGSLLCDSSLPWTIIIVSSKSA